MARKGKRLSSGTLVLDCQGLSKYIEDDTAVAAELKIAERLGVDVVISGMTLLEVQHPRVKQARLRWVLSTLVTVEPSIEIINDAEELLRVSGLHGHTCAIDAVVAATALRRPTPVTLLTSDPDDMRKLCGNTVEIVPI